jgi:DNA polymerase
MTGRVDPRLQAWLEFYDELGFTPFFRNPPKTANEKSFSIESEVTPESSPMSKSSRNEEGASPVDAAVPSGTFGLAQEGSLFDSGSGGKAGETLEVIEADLGECTRCKLHQGRTNIVFGTGNPKAKLVFVGEGPGADEDAQGLPFVGRAGKLLTKWIEYMDMTREDVYICNVVKCRPPGNRAPEKDEVAACSPFLFRQLDAIQPKLICCLGATALAALLGKTVAIGKMRGQFLDYRGIQMMPLYHPAYLLRPHPPKVDKDLKQDLKKIQEFVRS